MLIEFIPYKKIKLSGVSTTVCKLLVNGRETLYNDIVKWDQKTVNFAVFTIYTRSNKRAPLTDMAVILGRNNREASFYLHVATDNNRDEHLICTDNIEEIIKYNPYTGIFSKE